MSKLLKELLEEHPELNPENILFEDKSSYTEDQTKRFWKLIRELRYKYGSDDFTGVKFPHFERKDQGIGIGIGIGLRSANTIDFWNEGEPLELVDANFEKCNFLQKANFEQVNFKGEKTVFGNINFQEEVSFVGATFDANLTFFKNIFFHNTVNFTNTEWYSKDISFFQVNFHKKIQFGLSRFMENSDDVSFTSCTFLDDIEFGKALYLSPVNFFQCYFEKQNAVLDFSFSKYEKNINFSASQFKGSGRIKFLAVSFKGELNDLGNLNLSNYEVDLRRAKLSSVNFDGSSFKKLFLDNAYGENSSFMHVKAEDADRAGFRMIKYFYKKIHDDITANKYYAREMEAYEKEPDVSWNDRIVLWTGRAFSDHHQSWLLPIVWILFFGSQISLMKSSVDGILYWNILAISILVGLASTFIKDRIPKIGMLFVPILLLNIPIANSLNELAKHINPLNSFKIDDLCEGCEAPVLFFKILIGFAIYHFIVSVRKFSGK